MLANAQDRPDWRHVARLAPAASPLYLSCEDGTAPAAPSPRRAAVFPTTGVATLRSGWQTEDLFAGLKSGPSTVGHSHLDANSFVLEAAGQPLVIEHPYWPQAHFLGFFDPAALRWNFDGPATVGHSTLLVDGQGQTWGDGRDGRILGAEAGAAWAMAVGEAADCYPGLLRQFTRTLLIAGRDTVVIRDVIRCEGERHIEWLLHYAGDIRSDGILSVIENAGVRLTVQPLLPDRGQGWRWSDVTRTSLYECSDTRQPVTRQVRYRSFSPFRRAAQVEFLFLLRVNPSGGDDGMAFSGEAGAWRLAVPGSGCTVAPCGDRLVCTPMP
ncbi:MAG: Heparinase II/III-like protein [Lentisphaerae bacterium ADurb.BinA184]|nr:MAG: Heparinase II/III-like protein [Lentisphaerae bacterium ADurb.BinA184]